MKTYLKSLGFKEITQLKGFHNLIYMASYLEKEIVIRVSSRRNYDDIKEEVILLNEIKDNVPVNEPVAIQGDYVIQKDHKILSFYKKVHGQQWHETTLTIKTHFNAGRACGLLHLELQKINHVHRHSFDQHPDLRLLEDAPHWVEKELNQTINALKNHDEKGNAYGLIHGDYLYSNLIYNHEDVTIIDFDDIEFGYYLYDIAVYLFYLLLGGDPSNMDIEPNIEVFKYFIKGYRSVNNQTTLDFSTIQTLFRLRQLKLYATISKTMKPNQLGDWQKKYLHTFEHQVKNDLAFIDIDYEMIYKSI